MPSLTEVPVNFKRDAAATRHQARRHRMISRLAAGLHGRALDYGCGYGDITRLLAAQLEIQGVDVDVDRVEFARLQYPELEFTVCGSEGTEFSAGSFDAVISSVVLPFVPNPDSYLAEIGRLLRPAGELVIASKNIDPIRDKIRRAVGKGPATSPLHIMTAKELEKRLFAAGFEVVQRDYFYDPPFEDCKNFADACFSGVKVFGAFARIETWAEYYGFRARKTASLS